MRCDYCSKTIISAHAWNKHIDVELKNNKNCITTTCLNCGFDALTLRKLSVHLKTKVCRETDHPKDQCPYCDRCFTTRSIMQRHVDNKVCMNKLNTENQCHYCYQCFSNKNILQTHLDNNVCRHRVEAYSTQYIRCGVCRIKFKTQQELIQHSQDIRCVSPSIPKCDICNKVFATKYTLIKHVKLGVCTKHKVITTDTLTTEIRSPDLHSYESLSPSIYQSIPLTPKILVSDFILDTINVDWDMSDIKLFDNITIDQMDNVFFD